MHRVARHDHGSRKNNEKNPSHLSARLSLPFFLGVGKKGKKEKGATRTSRVERTSLCRLCALFVGKLKGIGGMLRGSSIALVASAFCETRDCTREVSVARLQEIFLKRHTRRFSPEFISITEICKSVQRQQIISSTSVNNSDFFPAKYHAPSFLPSFRTDKLCSRKSAADNDRVTHAKVIIMDEAGNVAC